MSVFASLRSCVLAVSSVLSLGLIAGCGSNASTNSGGSPKVPVATSVSWATPGSIVYGTALSAAQLNATASVAGTFAYTPTLGTVVGAGTQMLSVSFTPSDTANYLPSSGSVQLVVAKATPAVAWSQPAGITYGTTLGAAQLSATSATAGTFTYTPAAGALLMAGTATLSASFAPADAADYLPASASVQLVVGKATPTLTWSQPAAITYGTALSSTQLSATSATAGTMTYSPAAGAVPGAGTATLSASFAPADAVDYTTGAASVSLVVDKALPVIAWAAPAAAAAGSSITSAQLNATSPTAGTFAYTPAAGTVETVPGALTLQTVFTPADTADYLTANATTVLNLTGVAGTPSYTYQSVVIKAGGFTDELVFHPAQKGLLYARMDIGSAYRYDTGNSRWIPLLDWANRSQDLYFHSFYWGVQALAVDPTDPKWLYLAVGVGSGATPGNFLISSDQGATFTNVQLTFPILGNAHGREAADRLVVDPNLPSRLYLGTVSNGLWVSDNRGLTWTQSATFPALGTSNAQGISFVVPVATSGSAGSLTPMLFAGVAETAGGTLNTLYLSTNAGVSWTPVTGQISGSLLPLRGRLGPNHELYVTYDNGIGPDGISAGMVTAYTYTDAGAVGAPRNITPTLTAGSTAGFYDIEPDPSLAGALLTATVDSSYQVSGVNQDYIYRSVDDGKTWVQFTTDTHDISGSPWVAPSARNHDGDWINLAVDPFDSTHVIYGTGEMIYATNNMTVANTGGVVAWTEQANNEEEHNIRALTAPPSGSVLLYSGLDDHNGMQHYSLTTSPNRYPSANTNATSSIAYAETNPQIVARVGGNKDFSATAAPYGAYSTNGGSSWTTFANTPLPNSATGAGSIAVSADGGTLVWSPYDVAPVYSADGGNTWSLSAGTPGVNHKVVADHVNAGTFYLSSESYNSNPASSTAGSLYVSYDSGHTFAAVANTSTLPAADAFTNFALEGDVWLAAPYTGLYRNTGSRTNIVMTKDSHFTYAYQVAFGAPKPGSGYTYTVYVDGRIGSIDGIYRSTDGGNTWLLITDQQHQFGYLNCIEADRRTFGTVYLGTYGRGLIYGTSLN